jgi:hypothetical protein
MQKYLLVISLAMVCVACGPQNLERAEVPLAMGMRLNESADAAQLSPNLAELRSIKVRNLILELPLVADRSSLPHVAVDVPKEAKGLLDQYRVHLQLIFCNNNEAELFPFGHPTDPKAWFSGLHTEICRNLDLLKGFPLERVIIGGTLLQVAKETEHWRDLLMQLRKSYPGIPFSIGGRTELLEDSELAALSDEITIDYLPMAGKELKPESRTENQRIAALAQKLGKPIFIYRANIIGEDQLIQFKNRLRFWPEGVKLNGLAINTLYATVPTRDDHTYYGLRDNPDFMEFVQAYRVHTLK